MCGDLRDLAGQDHNRAIKSDKMIMYFLCHLFELDIQAAFLRAQFFRVEIQLRTVLITRQCTLHS
jgi:hypothetical protein